MEFESGQFPSERGFYNERRSDENRPNALSLASLILGVVSIFSSITIYLSLCSGSIAVVLALLSRGRSESLPPQSKAGLIAGVSGIVLTAILVVITVSVLLNNPGLFDEVLKMYGPELEQQMKDLMR